MLVVATVIGLIIATTRRDVGFVLVFVWAFTAIINKQSAFPVVTTTALITVIVLLTVLGGVSWSTIAGHIPPASSRLNRAVISRLISSD